MTTTYKKGVGWPGTALLSSRGGCRGAQLAAPHFREHRKNRSSETGGPHPSNSDKAGLAPDLNTDHWRELADWNCWLNPPFNKQTDCGRGIVERRLLNVQGPRDCLVPRWAPNSRLVPII